MAYVAIKKIAGGIAVIALSVIAIMPLQAVADESVQPDDATTVQSDGTTGSGNGADSNAYAVQSGGTSSAITGQVPESTEGNDSEGGVANGGAGTTVGNGADANQRDAGAGTVEGSDDAMQYSQPRSDANARQGASAQSDVQATNESTRASEASRRMDALAAANRDVLSDGTYTFASGLPGHRLINVAGGSTSGCLGPALL